MEISRIKILTIDRPKMTHDVTSVFVKHDINIIWMEAYTYVIYVKFLQQPKALWQQMKKELLSISGVEEVKEVDFIVLEEKELEVRAVLDSISQGIVIIDKTGSIKYVNQYTAEQILHVKMSEVIGKSLDFLDKTKTIHRLMESWDDRIDPPREEMMIRGKNYLVSTTPIISDDEKISSYMITLEDMNRIGELFNVKRYDNPITFDDIFGVSNEIKATISQAMAYSQSDSPVLILGESGTGKELFARAMHNASSRSSKIFVALNCAAIPDQLLESELFGYEEGAFTGGKKSGKTGLLEIANGGTVFLDEIGEMPPHLQAKLLRVLQENKIRKLGSGKEISINVRILTATNRDLTNMVDTGQFRLDLFYRINVFTLVVPPLRERSEDIRVLVDAFVNNYGKKYGKNNLLVHHDVLTNFEAYYWPGNVRELQNVIERAIAITEGHTIQPEHIQYHRLPGKQQVRLAGRTLKKTMEETERELISGALSSGRSIRETARSLGVTHTLLINRMKKYGIKLNHKE